MEDATTLVKTLYTLQNLLLKYVEIPRERLWLEWFTRLQIVLHLAEDPRPTDAATPDHHTIDAVAVKGLATTLGGGYVAVADNGNRHAGIRLDGADVRPARQ